MRRKMTIFALFFVMLVTAVPSYAGSGLGQATASLILPTTGQAMNGQIGNAKTKFMGGLEAGLITTTAILGGVVGGPIVWAGVGPLIGNHLWSAIDAYHNATPEVKAHSQQLEEAQRILKQSQERNRVRRLSFFDEPVVY